MTYEEAQAEALADAKKHGHLVAAVFAVECEWDYISRADTLLIDINVPLYATRVDYCECLNGKPMSEWRTLRQLEVAA